MLLSLKRQGTQMSVSAEVALPPFPPAAQSQETTLNVTVVFTSIRSTPGALKAAGAWASRLGAHITLIAPQVVPYPLPLANPDVEQHFSEGRFRIMAEECAEASKVETNVRLLWCRDVIETVLGALAPHSLVVLGLHKGWLPTSEKKLARQLRRAGHDVIVTETE